MKRLISTGVGTVRRLLSLSVVGRARRLLRLVTGGRKRRLTVQTTLVVVFLGISVSLITRLDQVVFLASAPNARTTPPPSPGASSAPAPVPSAQSVLLQARVVRVVDGDTVQVDPGGVVRIIGYETITDEEEEQASTLIAAMVDTYSRGTVLLQGDRADRAPGGELLRHIWLPEPDGRTPAVLLSIMLVEQGLAVPLEDQDFAQYKDQLLAALDEAQARCKGYWGTRQSKCASAAQTRPPTAAPSAPAASSRPAPASPAPPRGAASTTSPSPAPTAAFIPSQAPRDVAPPPSSPAARARPTATPVPFDPTTVATTYEVNNTGFNPRSDSGRVIVTGQLNGDGQPLWRASVNATMTVGDTQFQQACGQTRNDGGWSCGFSLQGIAPGTQGRLDVTFGVRDRQFADTSSILVRPPAEDSLAVAPIAPASGSQAVISSTGPEPTYVATKFVLSSATFNQRTGNGRVTITGQLIGDDAPIWRSLATVALTVGGERIQQTCRQTRTDGMWSCAFNLEGVAPGTEGTLDVSFTVRGQDYTGSTSILLRPS